MASNEVIFKTRAGLAPSVEELPYNISTSQVTEYLQKKLNAVIAGMRKSNEYNGPDIEVNVTTAEMSGKFVPFIVVLPTTVLKDNKSQKKSRDRNELDILDPKKGDRTANLYDGIAKMFASYTYNEQDGQAFSSTDWRRARDVSNSAATALKYNRRPTVQRFANCNMEKVIFVIDPIRVFYDMLVMEENNANFRVEIVDWQKIRSGEFKYRVKRVIRSGKNKKGGGNNFADEISRKMRGINK